MKKLLCTTLLFSCALLAVNAQQQERCQATWESLKNYKAPDWLKNAKFGVFIHWGVYSVPVYSNGWYPRHMYERETDYYKQRVAKYGTADKFGYKDFIPMFNAEKFNAGAWIGLFKKAGFKYVAPVADTTMVLVCTKLY